jgi:L-2-hydroxyglutarate oxidase
MKTDFLVVGGGIVGLATAHYLADKGRVVVLEKEARLACHQSGRNSGVIHSGIYYKPGSAKATNCRTGQRMMKEFCDRHAVPWQAAGKLIVARNARELEGLDKLAERARANGIVHEVIGPKRMLEIEPHVSGVAALHIPEASIIDYKVVCERLAELVWRNGEVHFQSTLVNAAAGQATVRKGQEVHTYRYQTLVNCAGLHSDRIARACGLDPDVMIVPFRGEYYTLDRRACHLVNGLVYPVPDPRFPFLGVHFTKMIDGGVECGPNAVLALGRESYDRGAINWRDLREMWRHRGLRRFLCRNWRVGLGELFRSWSKWAYTHALRGLIPAVQGKWLHPRPAGIRAQAMKPDGSLVDDFVIARDGDQVHVLNAPSPAATAALAIGRHIAGLV